MYYKIVSNGEIIDVCDGLNLVRWQKRIGAFLACDNAEDATGIVATGGSTIYLLEGAEQVKDLQYVTYAEIDEEIYNELLKELIANGVLPDTEDTESGGTDEDGDGQEPVKKSDTLKLIEALQEQVDILTECLLEMSETVYG